MSQRLTPRFLMYTVLAILVATGLSSTVGFKRIGSLIAGGVSGGDALHAHSRMNTALDEQMQSLLVLLERPLTPIEHDSLDRTIPTFEAELDGPHDLVWHQVHGERQRTPVRALSALVAGDDLLAATLLDSVQKPRVRPYGLVRLRHRLI
mgnify:CR=1 FL=1